MFFYISNKSKIAIKFFQKMNIMLIFHYQNKLNSNKNANHKSIQSLFQFFYIVYFLIIFESKRFHNILRKKL